MAEAEPRKKFNMPVFAGYFPRDYSSRPIITPDPLSNIHFRSVSRPTLSGISRTAATVTKREPKLKTVAEWQVERPHFGPHGMLEIAGMHVMRGEEREYMRHLARTATIAGGNTLEVGYGRGISAKFILSNPRVMNHTIIELNKGVFSRAKRELADEIHSGRVTLIRGDWKVAVRKLVDAGKKFDGILFDTFPLRREDEIELHANHIPFFPWAKRLLSENGVFTYYSDEPKFYSPPHLKKLVDAGFEGINGYCVTSNFGKTNDYWHHTTILAPIVTHKRDNPHIETLARLQQVERLRGDLVEVPLIIHQVKGEIAALRRQDPHHPDLPRLNSTLWIWEETIKAAKSQLREIDRHQDDYHYWFMFHGAD